MTIGRKPDLVAADRDGPVLTLRLGAAPAHPLSLAMIDALAAALGRARSDDAVRAVVIAGEGRIFCAGHDLKEIAAHRADSDRGRAFLETLFARCGAMMQALATFPKPTIARVEGLATAGGLQLLAACDLAIATPEARFCLPGVLNRGFCSTPSVAVGRAIARRHLMELALTGEIFDADWALRTGLVNRVVPADRLDAELRALALRVAAAHPPALALGKATLDAQLGQPLAEAYATASRAMLAHFMDEERIAHEAATWAR